MRRAVPSGAIVLAIALAVLVGRAGGALTATCTNPQVVPNIAELMVSQGAPGYTRYARGKEGLVRAYLTNPTVCTLTNKQSITPVSATLQGAYSTSDPDPAPLLNYAPLAGKPTATRQVYAASDPFFVVPASYFAPATTASFDITFTFTLTYNRTISGTTTSDTTSPPMVTVTVDQQTNALRVLIVPMGDPPGTAPQWSSAAETTLQNIMADTVRALPLPSGATPELSLPAPTSGARYRVSGDLLDVRSLNLYRTSGNVTKFCSNASNWNTSQVTSGPYTGHTLKGDLQERLDNYNLYNTPPADMVLGVIDGAIAFKSTDSGVICDDGRAATPDPIARTPGEVGWVRVDTGTFSTPLQMEFLHTLGVVDPTVQPSFHGPEIEADGGTSKGYNVLERKVVAAVAGALGVNDHSVMNYNTATIPYRRDNTLMVPRDWMDALCNLGGLESSSAIPFATCTDQLGRRHRQRRRRRRVDVPHHRPRLRRCGDGDRREHGNRRRRARDRRSKQPAPSAVVQRGLLVTRSLKRDVPLALSSQAPIAENHIGGGGSPPPGDTFSALVSLSIAPTVSATCAELRYNDATVFDACASDPRPTS